MAAGCARATLASWYVALFVVVLDNLVVTSALAAIRKDLAATLEQVEWTVNAYAPRTPSCC